MEFTSNEFQNYLNEKNIEIKEIKNNLIIFQI